jgi:protein TonB
MVLAMGETASRGSESTAGKAAGTPGKAADGEGIVEEGGQGAHLTALNAPEIQYISYFAGIKRKIELVWGYPAGAAGVEGNVVVDFVIGRNGRLESIKLIHGSGNRFLDDEAMGSIRKASPYDPIPSEYKIANLQIRAHFIYTVTHTRILR